MTTITQQIIDLTENNSVSVHYNIDLSRIYFDDWKEDLEGEGSLLMLSKQFNRQTDYIVIGDLSNPQYNKTELKRMKKEELIDLHELYFGGYVDTELWTKEELIADLLQVDKGQHYSTHYEENNWHDLEYDFIATGYSQGDAIKVLIIDEEYRWNDKEYLTNIFYDVPIHGTITFKGIDYYIEEYLNNQYEFWDKKNFINLFISQYNGNDKEEFKEFLEYSLPEDLEYV